jgi:hypothetical protein
MFDDLEISNDLLLEWRMEQEVTDPIITTSKFKNDKLIRRTVDYQAFTHKTLHLVAGLDQPSEELAPAEVANPSENHPSDHYALAYKYTFI